MIPSVVVQFASAAANTIVFGGTAYAMAQGNVSPGQVKDCFESGNNLVKPVVNFYRYCVGKESIQSTQTSQPSPVFSGKGYRLDGKSDGVLASKAKMIANFCKGILKAIGKILKTTGEFFPGPVGEMIKTAGDLFKIGGECARTAEFASP